MCLGNQGHPVGKFPSLPPSLLIPVSWNTRNALVLRPLSGSLACLPLGIWHLVLCLVTMGPAPANSEANRQGQAPAAQPRGQHSTLLCVSRKSIHHNLRSRGPSPPLPGSPLPRPARPLRPGSPAHLASGAPGILKCSSGGSW